MIFVKLWQMHPDDRTNVNIPMDKIGSRPSGPGVEVTPLYRDAYEDVRLEQLEPGAVSRIEADGGAEVLVLTGGIRVQDEDLPAWTWLRRADAQHLEVQAGDFGARLWIKTGHLPHVRLPT